jgi:hypothetical protein
MFYAQRRYYVFLSDLLMITPGIIETLFSESAGHFVTGYKDNRNVQSFHDVKVVQMLFPLLLDSVSSEQISCIVD